MFEVKNKVNFGLFIVNFEQISHRVSTDKFEQVNAGWDIYFKANVRHLLKVITYSRSILAVIVVS